MGGFHVLIRVARTAHASDVPRSTGGVLLPRGRRALLRLLAVALFGLATTTIGAAAEGPDSQAARPVRLATTTSTANTGLLDHLLAEFQKDTGTRVDVIAVGTGVALKHGENGDVDLVMVHAPVAEDAFVASGFGVRRTPVMWNDFVLLGPESDPASVKGAGVVEAFRRIAAARAPFVSRGDNSGTHTKEKEIWRAAGVAPSGDWYIEAGQGMGACLTLAHDRSAYILSDRGTALSRVDPLGIGILSEGDSLLVNPYSVIAIPPARYPDLNHEGAGRLIEWLTSTRGQALIAGFQVNGHQLFHPVAPADTTR